jgi:hypothetical protein
VLNIHIEHAIASISPNSLILTAGSNNK